MTLIALTVTIFIVIYNTHCAGIKSPCPHILKLQKSVRSGTWKGVLELRDQEGIQGIQLAIILDSKADSITNNFGEITTLNNRNFLINGLEYTLLPHEVLRVEFTVKYNQTLPPPNVLSIRLNGVEICANGLIGNNTATESSQLITTTKSTIRQYDAMCGVKPQDQPFLYDVEKMDEFWPWHAAILMLGNPQIRYICGGTLITDKFVLTAAHCVTVFSEITALNKDMLIIYLGITHLSDPGSSFVLRMLKDIHVHEEYDPTRYQHDLAILELDKVVEFNMKIRPVCLWDEGSEIEPLIGEYGTVVGYGKDENNGTISDLMIANMLIVGSQTCLEHDRIFFSQYTSPNTFCAGGGERGTSICGGDSGGGLVIPKLSTTGTETMWYIRGVVSVNPSDGDNSCNTKNYAVLTNIAQYLNWIQEKIRL